MPRTRRRYHHPGLKARLLDVAVRLIERDGIERLSMRRLAALSGVSHAAPYRHFENKNALVATLLLEGHRRLTQTLADTRTRTPGSAADKLLALGRAYLEFARRHAEYLNVMFSREGMASALSQGPGYEGLHHDDYDSFGELERSVRACQLEGSIDPTQDPAAVSMSIWAEVHGLALLRNEGLIAAMSSQRNLTEKQTINAVFDILRARLTPRA
jgi:AcrR family transcriptional regulator